jgi:hypothetical protein
VDVAEAVWVLPAPPDAQSTVDAFVEPLAPEHNVVRLYQTRQSSPDPGFHVPGLWSVDIDWVFRLDVTEDVLLNAVTFVQALGADSLFAAGFVLGGSYAQVDFGTRLALLAIGPPPLYPVEVLGAGDQDTGPERYLQADWWDVLGKLETTVYNEQSTLVDNGYNPVAGGSTVFVVVSAEVTQTADGNAFCISDFRTGDLQINVPAVYLSTFPAPPIG